jgi:hypothetical protein
MALRGPGAGGYTPPQSLSASNPCLNCGTNVQLTFCPECGQQEIDSDPTLREYLRELAGEFLRWDGKLFSTFRLLVTRPGELTREYIAGRRVRYVSPMRLFLACGLLYFFASTVIPNRSTNSGDLVLPRVSLLTPSLIVVLVPLLAALVMMVFRRSRRRFPQHLAFALHVHAYVFAILTLMLVHRFTSVLPLSAAIELAGGAAIAIYVVRATRTVYEVGTSR